MTVIVPKHLGRDCELSTSGVDPNGDPIHPWDVTRDVLTHLGAAFEATGGRIWTPRVRWGGSEWSASSSSSDTLRNWTSSGQCYYSDLSHCEGCTAETKDPRQAAAQCLSLMCVYEMARRRAEEEADPGTRYMLTAANVDMVDPGVSWGTHLNVAVSTELWEDLHADVRRPSRLGFVTSALAALVPFFGAGYVLPLTSGPVYSLAGRAHHLTRTVTKTTTEAYRRGLLNSRHEPHGTGQERMHLIGFDLGLASGALLYSTLQCCLAAAELGYGGLGLYDPVRAQRTWSHGLDLRTGRLEGVAELVGGGGITLSHYVRRLVDTLLEMCSDGSIPEEVAPGAPELLQRVSGLTHLAEEGALPAMGAHLDWAAKLLVLVGRCERDGLDLDDDPIRLADHDYASTDPTGGDFWRLWEEGRVDPLVTREDVDACLLDAPEDGRGWARGRLIQRFHDQITDMDWGYVELRRDESRWAQRMHVEMSGPGLMTRERFEPALQRAPDLEALRQILDIDHDESPDRDDEGDLRSWIRRPTGGPNYL